MGVRIALAKRMQRRGGEQGIANGQEYQHEYAHKEF